MKRSEDKKTPLPKNSYLSTRQFSNLLQITSLDRIRRVFKRYNIKFILGKDEKGNRIRLFSLEEVLEKIPYYRKKYFCYNDLPTLNSLLAQKPADLTAGEFIILFYLVFHKITFDVWPTPQKIAALAELFFNFKLRSVSTLISKLAQKGYLIVGQEFKYTSLGEGVAYRRYYLTTKGAGILRSYAYRKEYCPDCGGHLWVARDFVIKEQSKRNPRETLTRSLRF